MVVLVHSGQHRALPTVRVVGSTAPTAFEASTVKGEADNDGLLEKQQQQGWQRVIAATSRA